MPGTIETCNATCGYHTPEDCLECACGKCPVNDTCIGDIDDCDSVLNEEE